MGKDKYNYSRSNSEKLDFTLSITAGTYTAGQLIGHKITVSGPAVDLGKGGLIQSVILHDLGNQQGLIDVVFFQEDPASTTFTDQAAFDVDNNDLPKAFATSHVADWTAFNTSAFGQEKDANLAFALPSSQNTVYMACVARSTMSFTATNDLSGSINVLRD